MSQQVISSRYPYLPIRLTIRGQIQAVEALLDTGFDDDVIVPDSLLISLGWPDGYLRWTLADDSQVNSPSYFGTVDVGTFGPYHVAISILGGEPIVGRGLADRFAITLDHGQRVIVEL